MSNKQVHGMSKAKGCNHAAASNFSKLYKQDLCPGVDLSETEAAIIGGPGGIMHDFDGDSADSEVPAGYIFFAQFIDHDITLDTTSKLRAAGMSDEDIAKLPNIRTPSLDMDCVYGFGPEASPHIYNSEKPGRIATSPSGHDLARNAGGTALIGDPRNDENLLVSQMQLMFQKFHNKLFDFRHPDFEEAQKECRFHYQWLVWFDFLKRICDPAVYQFASKRLFGLEKGKFPLKYEPDAHGKLTMPVEFSVAAYRVGHTMVRSVYALNENHTDVELFDERFGTLGFSELPEELVVDWRFLLEVDDCVTPRFAKAFDALLADELQHLPAPVVPSNNPNDLALAFRNLLRGNALSLPSGQCMARQFNALKYPGITPLTEAEIASLNGWDRLVAADAKRAKDLAKNTPLFLYVLHESEVRNKGKRFGPVGSAILMEVFGGMLKYCESFIHEPDWTPDPCVSKERYGWWDEEFATGFDKEALISDENYYPFELADVVRYLQDV